MRLYRSGTITPLGDIANPASLFFDRIAHICGADKLPSYQARSVSVFMALTHDEARVWSGWRREDGLDADVWCVEVDKDYYIYDVSQYDLFAEYYRNFNKSGFPEYWYGKMVQAVISYYRTATLNHTQALSGQWELLIPYMDAQDASWVLQSQAKYSSLAA